MLKMLSRQGMPSMRHHDYGNLYIQFDIKFPENDFADTETIRQLESILPARRQQAIPPPDSMTEDFALEEVDAGGQRRAQGATSMDEEDEDGMPAGGERMQCASQ